MEDLEKLIQDAVQSKAERKVRVVKGTLERFEATEFELQKLITKRDNLNVQIQALQAKQAARKKQLEFLDQR